MKILIVDDSEVIRTQLRKDLEVQYTVIDAADGIDALERLAQNSDIKLVITDVNMPRMDGLALARKIHESPASANLPVIVMTTEMGSDLKAKGKEAGVLAWVTKPYNPEKLMQVVAKVVK